AAIGRRFGSRKTVEDIAPRFREAWCRADQQANRWFGELGRTNEIYEREFWRRVVREVLPDVTDSAACFEELVEHFARPESWRCFEDVESTITTLTARGYRVLIASNFDARLHRVCDGLPELRAVFGRVISSLVGYRKTHPGFFTALAQQAECEPRELLMVGDDLQNDVQAARQAGVAAVHLRREQHLVPRFEDHPDATDGIGKVPATLASLTELLEWLP
ncbi:MAG TPA: HAD family hydrolase, partial [Planctomycetaceae bacterium]|nr:HAD family hydrolase [Planctomycetaceae bacterium]